MTPTDAVPTRPWITPPPPREPYQTEKEVAQLAECVALLRDLGCDGRVVRLLAELVVELAKMLRAMSPEELERADALRATGSSLVEACRAEAS